MPEVGIRIVFGPEVGDRLGPVMGNTDDDRHLGCRRWVFDDWDRVLRHRRSIDLGYDGWRVGGFDQFPASASTNSLTASILRLGYSRRTVSTAISSCPSRQRASIPGLLHGDPEGSGYVVHPRLEPVLSPAGGIRRRQSNRLSRGLPELTRCSGEPNSPILNGANRDWCFLSGAVRDITRACSGVRCARLPVPDRERLAVPVNLCS